MDQDKNRRTKKWHRVLPGLIISALSLIAVFYLADVRRMAEALRLADYRLVALMYLISLLWLLVRTIVWRTLLQEKATFSQVFFTLNEGYLLNNILPFRLGEVARGYLISQKAGEGAGKTLSFMEAISTILIERALDVAMAAGLLLCTLPFVVGAGWAMEAAIAAGSLVLVGLATFYLLARYRTWAIGQFERLAARWPRLQGAVSRQLSAFLNGLAVLTDLKRFLRAVAWMFVNWGIAIVQYFVLLSAFYPAAKPLWSAFALGVTSLGIAAPSSPGAVGVLELAMVGALSAFKLDPSTALAAALTAHLTNYLITGVIGAFALARDGLTLSGVFKQAQRISPDTPGAP